MSSAPSFLNPPPSDNKRDVPLLAPILIGVFVLALVGLMWLQFHKAATSEVGTLSITGVKAVELSNHTSVLVVIEMKIKDLDEQPLTVFSVETTAKAGGKEYSDSPASVVELPRYFQAFPEIRSDATPLATDSKIKPNEEKNVVVAVSYPLTRDAFDKRESLQVKVNFREQKPIVAKQ